MGQFSKPKQTSSDQENFEELANKTTGLLETLFVSCFISGLRGEIREGVQMFQPKNISRAIGLAKLQEMSLEEVAKRSKNSVVPSLDSCENGDYGRYTICSINGL